MSRAQKPLKILVIYENMDPPERTRLTILHHLRVLECSDTRHDITYHNAWTHFTDSEEQCLRERDRLLAGTFDAVILHYSFLNGARYRGIEFYEWKPNFDWVRDLSGVKVAVVQDEGDFASLLDEWLLQLDVRIIFSVHYRPDGPLYPIMRNKAAIYPCLPGYIHAETAEAIRGRLLPIARRPTDIVYRVRHLPLRYGWSGRLKCELAEVVGRRARALGLSVDISTTRDQTLVGMAWLDFIASGRAVPGGEGGYSAVDWRGELAARIDVLLKEDPGLTLEGLSARLPPGWDDYRLFTITPRHFEAVITKTSQLLIEGEYKGILEPERHYIPLKRDYSDLDQALARLRDHRYLQEMVDRSYEELYQSGRYTYGAFARQIEDALREHLDSGPRFTVMKREDDPTDKAVDALERELIALRHEHALFLARLPDLITERVASVLAQRVHRRLKRALLWTVAAGLGLVAALALVLLAR